MDTGSPCLHLGSPGIVGVYYHALQDFLYTDQPCSSLYGNMRGTHIPMLASPGILT